MLVFDQLIEAGANVNHQARNKWTPLHCASAAGDAHACAMLVEGGADIKAEVRRLSTRLFTPRIYFGLVFFLWGWRIPFSSSRLLRTR